MSPVLDAKGELNAVGAELGNVLKHTLIYGIGGILLKAVSFLLLPFFTHYLSPKDYGVIELLDVTMSLLGMFLNMGISNALLRFYGATTDPHEQRRIVGTVFVLVFGTAGAALGAGLLFVPRTTTLLLGPDIPATYFWLSFGSLILGYICNVPYTYLRARQASGTLVSVDFVAALVTLMLSIYFIAVMKLSLLGALLSPVMVNVVKTVVLVIWMRRGMILTVELRTVYRILAFGAPLISFNLMMFTLNFSDRIFLKHYRSLAIVGLYGVGYKFGYMVNFLVIQPFFQMWQARMYGIRERSEHAKVFSVVFILFSLTLAFAALGIAAFSSDIARIMLDSRYRNSDQIMALVAFGYVVLGVAYFVQLGMFLQSRTGLIGIVSGMAAMITLVANYVLISRFGMLGAAWATIVGFLALAVGSYACSQRVFPLDLPIGRFITGLAMAVGIYGVSRIALIPHVMWSILLDGALVLSYPVVIWTTNVLSHDEKELLNSARHSTVMQAMRLLRTVRGATV